MIVEQTQVGLQAQPHPAGRFRVICSDEVVILILKKRFPILSFRLEPRLHARWLGSLNTSTQFFGAARDRTSHWGQGGLEWLGSLF